MKRIVQLLMGLTLMTGIALDALASVKTVTIKQENAKLVLDINYPQGYANNTINQQIERFINKQKEAILEINKQDNLSADIPGKNGIYINYETKFARNNLLSLVFTVSSNTRGAAHPANSIKTFNYYNGVALDFDSLFTTGSDAANQIAKFCHDHFVKLGRSDENWISEGTKATAENYRSWYFTKSGLMVVFDTYQVAAYVYGPQKVLLPYSMIKPWVKPEIAKAAWGSA
ncbi:endo-1,4-beta-xylanase-like protein [Legionella birminghamensis]|uniref:Endo-1,4-beta-xylanase-like protein n=1 Tax=Legionella birminghamensis TaxID=28083 RepID=A0A378I8H6_9GAMM|nr:DUF3298 and DUF4163 domain-containing protein [Legionella birminghamensis]KTC68259.1 endo-1,4-beta-xylanase-like protein [Legionella birminghamensis]STX31030.1 endo-1,4-beta-xylanase-like protein [Legionella birminghamensis]